VFAENSAPDSGALPGMYYVRLIFQETEEGKTEHSLERDESP